MGESQPTVDNRGGTLHGSNGFSANVCPSRVVGLSDHGQRRVGRTANSATGTLTANVACAMNYTGGTLVANQGVALGAGSLDNTQGNIQSAQAGVQLAVANQLTNGSGGTIGHGPEGAGGLGRFLYQAIPQVFICLSRLLVVERHASSHAKRRSKRRTLWGRLPLGWTAVQRAVALAWARALVLLLFGLFKLGTLHPTMHGLKARHL
jgi:adhesin HecA-like repeat protein